LDRDFLVRLFGFGATLIHGDLLVLDRWRWLKRRLPRTANNETLIDIGCGNGAMSIGAAIRGYATIGLSWDESNQASATRRARLCGVNPTFPIQDVRKLGEQSSYFGQFDVAICFENIEHILDDLKLLRDIERLLKPGGLLLLTTPNWYYREMSAGERGPFRPIEDGGHVRRGYTPSMIQELCDKSGLFVEEISSCSGFFSQNITIFHRTFRRFGVFGWIFTLPLRIIPSLLDDIFSKITSWPDYSLCLVAYKPRFSPNPPGP
jgi:SAM-dependent methyltransferase